MFYIIFYKPYFTLCSIYQINHHRKLMAIQKINLDCFTIGKPNQVNISCKIMQCQVYF